MDKLDTDIFASQCNRRRKALEDIAQPATEEEVEDMATKLTQAMTEILKSATPKRKRTGKGQAWWNAECADTARKHRQKRHFWRLSRGFEDEEETKTTMTETKATLRQAVRRAKKSFYKKVIEDITEPKDVFRAAKWADKKTRYATPPMNHQNGTKAITTEEKSNLLLDTHTIPAEPTTEERPIEIIEDEMAWPGVSDEEVKRALFKPKDTSPGEDKIPNSAWKKAWPYLKTIIMRLFQACVGIGYHPNTFKQANMIAIVKPNRDKTLPRSYRLISLLSTLGKAIERLVAARLAREAISKDIIPSKYICATPKRAVTDLTLDLIDEIQSCLKNRYRPFATLLTFDIKGAFDSVSRTHLQGRLEQQKWPKALRKWVDSFLTNRKVQLTVDGQTTAERKIGGSLPQGSPASPILFMLFMAPLYHDTPAIRGYADDGSLLVTSGSFDANVEVMQGLMRQVQGWCENNGLSLDISKTGLIHCTTKNIKTNPNVIAPDGTVIEATKATDSLRWLGLHIDRKLKFNAHVQQAIGKAKKTVNGMRLLAGCYKGTAPASLLSIVRSCVQPQLTYAASSWWPSPGVKRRVSTITEKMDIVLRAALRAALPIYKTTPKHLVFHGASYPPSRLILDDAIRAEAIRISIADDKHFLRTSHIDGKIDTIVCSLPYRVTGTTNSIRGPLEVEYYLPEKRDKEEELKQHTRDLNTTITENAIWAYSDGSKDKNGNTGAGWAAYWRGTELASGFGRCGAWREVPDAEAIAAYHAVKTATEVAPPEATDIYLCTDNRGIAQRIARPSQESGGRTSEDMVDKTRRLLNIWQENTTRKKAEIRWLPGHAGINGNERVDRLAKRGTADGDWLVKDRTMTLSAARRWRKRELAREFSQWWADQEKPRHLPKQLNQPIPWEYKWMKNIPRPTLARIFAARSAHGDFADYHIRFAHDDAQLTCPLCHEVQVPNHPWQCETTKSRPRVYNSRFINKLLLSNKGARHLAKALPQAWQAYRPRRTTAATHATT